MQCDPTLDDDLPDIDDHLVESESRFEVWDGELVYVPPADAPHSTRHIQLGALIEAHTGPDFEVACDMLTRTSRIDDIAPDVSVFPSARDPRTGRRQLEHLSFEIVSTQSLSRAGKKAAKLTGRGVRRVFALDLERSRVLEWSIDQGAWIPLDAAGRIVDLALAVPLPIQALIHDAKADDMVVRALAAKNNAVIEEIRAEGRTEAHAEGRAVGHAEGRAVGHAEGRAEGHAEGRAEGHAEGRTEGHAEGRAEGHAEGRIEGVAQAVIMLLVARSVDVSAADRERILAERDAQRLGRWLVHAASCATAAELLVDDTE